MPTYEYECSSCLHCFEAFQQMKDEPLKNCPKCGGKVKRLISSGGGLIFKGAGFYATDYKKSAAGIKKTNQCQNSHSCSVNCPHKNSD